MTNERRTMNGVGSLDPRNEGALICPFFYENVRAACNILKVEVFALGKIWSLMKLVWRDWRSPKQKRMFGVYMFVGEVGEGKTLSAIQMIEEEKAKDSDLKVYTNFHYIGQDGEINHWKDMLEVPSYSIIAIDEVQNTFNQRNWSSFPPSLIPLLTQNRKWGSNVDGVTRPPGIRLIMTTQDYENTDIFIRRLTNRVIQCRSFFKGRMISNKYYKRKEFERSDEKRKREKASWFVGTEQLRDSYNTYLILDDMKNYQESDKKTAGNGSL